MKNESWLGGGKYSKKVLYENGTSDRTPVATEQKKSFKVLAIVRGSVMVWSSRLIIFGKSYDVFLERNYRSDSFPGIFHVIDIIFKILVMVIFFTLL